MLEWHENRYQTNSLINWKVLIYSQFMLHMKAYCSSPFPAARCIGVSRLLFWALPRAPCCSRMFTASSFPLSEAMCRGVYSASLEALQSISPYLQSLTKNCKNNCKDYWNHILNTLVHESPLMDAFIFYALFNMITIAGEHKQLMLHQ